MQETHHIAETYSTTETHHIAETRYTVKTPTGETLTGTAGEITRQLQAQDWQPDGVDAGQEWRHKVAGRVQVQTGRSIPTESADGFLMGLAAAGLLTLEPEESKTDEHKSKTDEHKSKTDEHDGDKHSA